MTMEVYLQPALRQNVNITVFESYFYARETRYELLNLSWRLWIAIITDISNARVECD